MPQRPLREMLVRWVPAYSRALMCHLRKGEDLEQELQVRGGEGQPAASSRAVCAPGAHRVVRGRRKAQLATAGALTRM